VTVYTDASGKGLGFWIPALTTGFFSDLPEATDADSIFYYEALAICCAIHHISISQPACRRLVIFSDSHNSVDIFNSYRASDIYNRLLQFAVDILIPSKIDLRVLHVAGEDNPIADALSRGSIDLVHAAFPSSSLFYYKPP
ncbi:hypothetical protein BD410DRAFT_696929, partial [Rickenella mellea]